VLGAEDKITEIEPFQSDSLYLQIFQALFPQFDFEEIAPGKNVEEMADNIGQLISLLEKNLLETDLSDIKASGIVGGDLVHIDEFLQVLLQVVFLMVQNQGEGEESEEELDTVEKKRRSSAKRANSGRQDRGNLSGDDSAGELDLDDNYKDETDTQKIAADLGLNSPELEEGEHEIYDEMDHGKEKVTDDFRDLEHEYEDQLRKDGFEMEDEDHHSQGHSEPRHDKNGDMEDNALDPLNLYGPGEPNQKQIIDDEEDN